MKIRSGKQLRGSEAAQTDLSSENTKKKKRKGERR
jgi:hypothetical protein